jgi:hypothetical protein
MTIDLNEIADLVEDGGSLREIVSERGLTVEQVREVGSILRARQSDIALDIAEVEHVLATGDIEMARSIMDSPGFRAFLAQQRKDSPSST